MLLDTTADAARTYYDIIRRMAPEARLQAALDMNEMLRAWTAAGVRERHPDYDDERVRLAAIRLQLGDGLFAEAYPGAQVRP